MVAHSTFSLSLGLSIRTLIGSTCDICHLHTQVQHITRVHHQINMEESRMHQLFVGPQEGTERNQKNSAKYGERHIAYQFHVLDVNVWVDLFVKTYANLLVHPHTTNTTKHIAACGQELQPVQGFPLSSSSRHILIFQKVERQK